MNKIDFHTLEISERKAIFETIAEEKRMTAFAVEKDWWVSRTLELVFQMEISKFLVFKGGTSLSKAWKLIDRFSEDIDLSIDRSFFFPNQVVWSKREITKLRKAASIFVSDLFLKNLEDGFIKRKYEVEFKLVESNDSDQDPRIIEIYYPNVISSQSEYILPKIQLEIGCRSLREPHALQKFGSLVDEHYLDSTFSIDLFEVTTVLPERTFLEKLFLLHEEFHRPMQKIRVDRLSRHLYDIYHLYQVGIGSRAIRDKELYETIVQHRYTFTRIGGVDYNSHHPKSINPYPIPEIISAWRKDYSSMLNEMIYEENPPSFEQLMESLSNIKLELLQLAWNFELSFPLKK